MASKTLKLSSADLDRAIFRGVSAEVERHLANARAATVERPKDLLAWSRRYLPHYFTCGPSEMHKWIAQKFDTARKQRGSNINVVGPRGGAKSTVGTTAGVLCCAVEATEPLIWIISETSDQAEEQLANVRLELEENELLARDYPEACGPGPTWSSSRLRLKNNVVIQAFGTGKKIRGRKNRASRPSLIVCDDLQSEDVMLSAERRTKNWTWLTSALLKAGNSRTNVINLANAIHREAIGLRLMRTPGWDAKTFRAIIEWPVNMHLWEQWEEIFFDVDNPEAASKARAFYETNKAEMDRGAVLLWPEWEDLYTLMALRARDGRSTFEREKQGRPINPEDNEWPESYFDDHIWFDTWPERWQVKTLALDPSKGADSRRSDYSAFVSLMIGHDGVLYVDADLERRPPEQMVSDGADIYQAFQPDGFGVESNAWQDLLGGIFEREFQNRGMIDPAPYAISNHVKKQMRIRRLGPLLSQRRIRFLRRSPGCKLLIDQLRDFPDIHAHDDGPDALEMAYRLAKQLLAGAEDDEGGEVLEP